jgi:hypothetical protein
MKIRILAIEYPEENEQKVHEILDSVFFTNMLKRIAEMKYSEVTAPYDGDFDAFVNDIICLLLSHCEGTEELMNAVGEQMPHVPELVKQFGLVRERLEGEDAKK